MVQYGKIQAMNVVMIFLVALSQCKATYDIVQVSSLTSDSSASSYFEINKVKMMCISITHFIPYIHYLVSGS